MDRLDARTPANQRKGGVHKEVRAAYHRGGNAEMTSLGFTMFKEKILSGDMTLVRQKGGSR